MDHLLSICEKGDILHGDLREATICSSNLWEIEHILPLQKYGFFSSNSRMVCNRI